MCHIKQTQKNFFPALLFIPIFIQCALFSDQHIWLPFISTFAWNAISKAIYAYCQLSLSLSLSFSRIFFSLYSFYPCIIKLNGHWLLVVTYSRLLLGILSHSSIYNSFSFWRWMNIFFCMQLQNPEHFNFHTQPQCALAFCCTKLSWAEFVCIKL